MAGAEENLFTFHLLLFYFYYCLILAANLF
jgi:hypothetical protein